MKVPKYREMQIRLYKILNEQGLNTFNHASLEVNAVLYAPVAGRSIES